MSPCGMRIHASIRPPAHVVAHLEAAISAERSDPRQISWIASPHWRLHLAGFGNVVRGDAVRLCQVFVERVRDLPPPRLRLSRVTPLPDDRDDSVSVDVEGDLTSIDEIATSIPSWVYEFGFVLDRRAYRPRMQLARITEDTTLDYLQRLVERLGSYEGPVWDAASVTLGREKVSTDGHASFEVFEEAAFSAPR